MTRSASRVCSVLTLSLVGTAHAATNGLIQYPCAAPDNQTIVFSAQGDLWASNPDGGIPTRLTTHAAIESRSCFSPDGTKLAFESNRDGTDNLYVADVTGSGSDMTITNIRRVTVSDRSHWLGSFDESGKALLFSAYMNPDIYRQPEMYRVPLDGGPIERFTEAYGRGPTLGDNELVYFVRGYYYPHRSVYRGPGNIDIWSLDRSTSEFKQVTTFAGNDLDPAPLPDGSLLYLSSRDGTYNVYRLDPNKTDRKGRSGDQLTHFAPGDDTTLAHGVRDLRVSPDGTTAYFVCWNTLYSLDLTERKPEPRAIELTLNADHDRDRTVMMDLSRKVNEAAIHPSGEAVVVQARNELFIRSTKEGYPTRRITNTPTRERDLVWSPDGSVLYFTSDDEDSLGSIFAARVTLSTEDLKPKEPEEDKEAKESEEDPKDESADSPETGELPAEDATDEVDPTSDDDSESESEAADEAKEDEEEKIDHGARWAGALRFEIDPVVVNADNCYAPNPSPDGTKLIYKKTRGDVILRDLDTGDERVLVEAWSDPEVLWAADSVHIVFADTDLDFNSDIFILDTRLNEDGSSNEPVNITQHPDVDHSPRLSADGKVLTFLSDRDSDNWSWDVYTVALDRALEGMPKYELEQYYKDAAAAAKKREVLDPKDPPEIEPFEFDTDDAYLRINRLTRTPGSEGNLAMSAGGERIAFTQDGKFVSVDPWGKEEKTINGSGVSDPRVGLNGSSISFISGGQAHSSTISGGKSETLSIDARVEIDRAKELAQKFEEASARFGLNFYHPTLKGLDWEAMTERYRELALQTKTNEAFQRVMNFMFGELDGSHTGIWGGDGFSASSSRTGYLGIDVASNPAGYEVTRIYSGGPIDRMKDGIQVGDTIIAVGDTDLVNENGKLIDFYTALANTSGSEVLIEYTRPSDSAIQADDGTEDETIDGSRFALVNPISYGAHSVMRYNQEVLDRREQVEQLSNGKLGYLHIRSMGAASVRDFERDLFAAANGKDGLVIDVRDNGGGWTTDILLASLTAPAHAYTIPRGANPDDVRPDSYPRDRRLIYGYSRPIVVLINENSFSNAEIFAHSIRTAKRGRLVGKQTFGGVISTGSFSLIDGTTVREPFRGWYLPDGTDMENNGAKPDVEVEQTPEDEANGQDPQLEAAVKDLLRTIK